MVVNEIVQPAPERQTLRRSDGQEHDHQKSHRSVTRDFKARRLAACLTVVPNFGMDRISIFPVAFAVKIRPSERKLTASTRQ
jgi:hypothetical protein